MASLEAILFVLFVSFVDDAFLSCVCVTSAGKKAAIILGMNSSLNHEQGRFASGPEGYVVRLIQTISANT